MKREAGEGHPQHIKQLLSQQLWLWQRGQAREGTGDELPRSQLHLQCHINRLHDTSDCTLLLGFVFRSAVQSLGYGCDHPVGKALTGLVH